MWDQSCQRKQENHECVASTGPCGSGSMEILQLDTAWLNVREFSRRHQLSKPCFHSPFSRERGAQTSPLDPMSPDRLSRRETRSKGEGKEEQDISPGLTPRGPESKKGKKKKYRVRRRPLNCRLSHGQAPSRSGYPQGNSKAPKPGRQDVCSATAVVVPARHDST